MKPQLLVSGALSDLPRLCTDDRYVGMQKLDGKRLILSVDNGKITGFNRRGEPTSVPAGLLAECRRINGSWVFDGELMPDGAFWCFDMPQAGAYLTASSPYSERRLVLEAAFTVWQPGAAIKLLPVARTPDEKVTLAKRLLAAHAEGMVFYDVNGRYTPGQRNRDVIKAKNVKTVDCWASELRRDGKDNFVLSVYRDGIAVEVGECTALAGDGPRVKVGDVVTVKVLYASEAGRVVQPTFPVIRGDKRPDECDYAQIVAIRTNKAVLCG